MIEKHLCIKDREMCKQTKLDSKGHWTNGQCTLAEKLEVRTEIQ